MTDENIAEVCYEANRAYCRTALGEVLPPWAEAPEWQRTSTTAGVAMMRAYPNTTPQDSHIAWLEHKAKDGWKYGPVKDAAKKEHPCFLPYSDLPANQRVKDTLFGSICRSLLSA